MFWCGDFNYRIDMDKDELKEKLKQGLLNEVLEHDQLRVSQFALNSRLNSSKVHQQTISIPRNNKKPEMFLMTLSKVT